MKHGVKKRKLGRVKKERESLVRSLALSLITHERIETTQAKAKELRPFIEKLVTAARTNNVATRRLLSSRLSGNEEAVKKLIEVIAPRYYTRPGGYTRITKASIRQSDSAPRAVIEFI